MIQYQILKTHIVRNLFYFSGIPLALLSRACCFETCNTCCASINQFSCLLSSYQTLIHFIMKTLYYQMGVRKTGLINRDSGIEIPEAWMPTIKKHKTGELCNSRLPRELITEWNRKDRNAPIRAVEKQLITAEHQAYKIRHDQLTSSPEEDQQYAVETSPSTSHVTTLWDKQKN